MEQRDDVRSVTSVRALVVVAALIACYVIAARMTTVRAAIIMWAATATGALSAYRIVAPAAATPAIRRNRVRIAAAIAALLVFYALLGTLRPSSNTDDISWHSPSPFEIVVWIISIPIVEEVVFRGFLYQYLSDRLRSATLVVALTSVVFGMVHVLGRSSLAVLLPALVLGVVLGLARLWSGRIWLPIVVHMANNALVTVLRLS